MSLKNKINEDLLAAFRSGKRGIVSALRFLMSVIKNAELLKRTKLSKEGKPAGELEKLSELTDEEITGVILSEIKKRKESIVQYGAGGRKDLAEKEITELAILKKYVPEEMGEEELRILIKKKISDLGLPAQAGGITAKDFGKVMGLVMAEIKGRAGGDAVKKIIEEELK